MERRVKRGLQIPLSNWVLAVVCCLQLSFLTSCSDIADDEHYAQPSWLKGNAWQVMEQDGHYTDFMKAIELTGYRDIVEGHSILTVMASNDDAWREYLSEQGCSTVDELWQKDPKLLKNTV